MSMVLILIGSVYIVAILTQLRCYVVSTSKTNAETGKLEGESGYLTAQ
jgi:hypothetical protein